MMKSSPGLLPTTALLALLIAVSLIAGRDAKPVPTAMSLNEAGQASPFHSSVEEPGEGSLLRVHHEEETEQEPQHQAPQEEEKQETAAAQALEERRTARLIEEEEQSSGQPQQNENGNLLRVHDKEGKEEGQSAPILRVEAELEGSVAKKVPWNEASFVQKVSLGIETANEMAERFVGELTRLTY